MSRLICRPKASCESRPARIGTFSKARWAARVHRQDDVGDIPPGFAEKIFYHGSEVLGRATC